jgi:hypothetical protein
MPQSQQCSSLLLGVEDPFYRRRLLGRGGLVYETSDRKHCSRNPRGMRGARPIFLC